MSAQKLFLSYWFVSFAAIYFPLYWFVPIRRIRTLVLLAGCVIFHTHFAGPAGVLPILVLMLLTYLAGLTRWRPLCATIIVVNVLALVFYKYTKFLALSVVGLLWPASQDHLTTSHPFWLDIVAPLAI